MASTKSPFDPLTDPDGRTWRAWTFVSIAVAILVIGLGASTAGAWASHRPRCAPRRRPPDPQAQAQSEALTAALRRDLDFVDGPTALFTSVPLVTNRQLASWYTTLDVQDRYPGTIGFGFVQRVPAVDLAAFGAIVLADPLNYGDTTAPYTVVPPTPRSEYCLQRYSTVLDVKRLGQVDPHSTSAARPSRVVPRPAPEDPRRGGPDRDAHRPVGGQLSVDQESRRPVHRVRPDLLDRCGPDHTGGPPGRPHRLDHRHLQRSLAARFRTRSGPGHLEGFDPPDGKPRSHHRGGVPAVGGGWPVRPTRWSRSPPSTRDRGPSGSSRRSRGIRGTSPWSSGASASSSPSSSSSCCWSSVARGSGHCAWSTSEPARGAPLPGAPRRPDRTPEPHPLYQRARTGPGHRRPGSRGRHAHGPRRLQGSQRHPRSPPGDQLLIEVGRATVGHGAGCGQRGAPRRGRVRDPRRGGVRRPRARTWWLSVCSRSSAEPFRLTQDRTPYVSHRVQSGSPGGRAGRPPRSCSSDADIALYRAKAAGETVPSFSSCHAAARSPTD